MTIGNWKDCDRAIAPAAAADFGGDKIEYLYSKADVRDFSIETLPTKAGEYIVKAFILGTDDYEAADAEATFTVYSTSLTPAENADSAKIIASEKGLDPKTVFVVSVGNNDDAEKIADILTNNGFETTSDEVTVSEVEYTDMYKNGNVTFETDKLSRFAFVADNT